MRTDIVFVGLARNCAAYASNFHWLRDTLYKVGVSSMAVVGEDGSTDNTREVLSRTGVSIIDTSFMSNFSRRLERMARGRQKVAEAAREIKADAYCVIDLDNTMASPPDPTAMIKALRHIAEGHHFAISAQSRPFYYDLLAYEAPEVSFAGIDRKIADAQAKRDPFAYYRIFRDIIYPAQRDLSSNNPIECISAFNGLCLYGADAFAQGSYVQNADFGLCEHVNFNRRIYRQSSQLMQIAPYLTVAMPPEHGPTGPASFAAERLMKALGADR